MQLGALQTVAEQSAERRAAPASRWAASVALLAGLVMAGAGALPDPAWGQFSSGGYSRPSSGGYGRPSSGFGRSYSAPVRRPPAAGSGGYTRRPPSAPGGGFISTSPGDRAMSRSNADRALRDYQAGQRPPPQPDGYARRPPSPGSGGGWGWPGASGSGGGWGGPVTTRRPPAGGGGWWGPTAQRQFPGGGILTTIALWTALNALTSSPGQAEIFHANRDSQVYRDWRREAETAAARDPEVAKKLDELDKRIAELDRQAPVRHPAPSSETGFGSLWGVLFVVGGVVVLFWLWRRRRAGASPSAAAGTRGGTQAPTQGLGGSAGSRFRVGMVLPIDPAPFLLAGGLAKVQPPSESRTISVEAVGLLRTGGVLLHRLYLPGGRAFFQLHLGDDGRPDECRYFSVLDEVTPAGPDEWGFWLDPAQGMIGWPSFQTKDGKVYGRVWASGQSRVAPRAIEETLQHLDRVEQRRMQAMLYAGPTGGAAPAPETEYILVSAIDIEGQAWVEIDAGIDINPAALNLPSFSLAA
jgi:Protein of unknown function (DUF2491)